MKHTEITLSLACIINVADPSARHGKITFGISFRFSFLIRINVFFPQIFAGIFTTDAALVAFTAKALRVYLAVMFLFGIQISCQMAFNSLGRAVESIIVAVVRKFVLLIPLIYIIPQIFRADQTTAVYMAEPVADLIAVTFTAILFSVRFKKALREI